MYVGPAETCERQAKVNETLRTYGFCSPSQMFPCASIPPTNKGLMTQSVNFLSAELEFQRH